MKRFVLIACVIIIGAYLTGCGKKQQSLEQMQEPMSMEALSTLKAEKTAGQAQPEAQTQQAAPQLAQLPPSGPYKPSVMDIQTALKNAGYYTGNIDGKIGPKTKAAIQAFQKANGLTADGKVGSKTWSLLSAHLNPPTAPTAKE